MPAHARDALSFGESIQRASRAGAVCRERGMCSVLSVVDVTHSATTQSKILRVGYGF